MSHSIDYKAGRILIVLSTRYSRYDDGYIYWGAHILGEALLRYERMLGSTLPTDLLAASP